MNAHLLLRVNPKGEDFIGRCMYCHKEGFKIDDKSECPNALAWEQRVLDAING